VTATITLTEIGGEGDVLAGLAARDAFIGGPTVLATQGFGGLVGTPNPSTNVGTFVGGGGSFPDGSTAINCGLGDGLSSCVRTGNVGDRYDVDGDEALLDSNDMERVVWSIPGGSALSQFNQIAFLVTDIDDVQFVRFTIEAAGSLVGLTTVANTVTGGLASGRLHLVTMAFDDFVSDLTITMTNGRNDGFGIDAIAIAAVPVPAAGLLLLGGLGGLAALKRRKKA
jgi:hypothetical protein